VDESVSASGVWRQRLRSHRHNLTDNVTVTRRLKIIIASGFILIIATAILLYGGQTHDDLSFLKPYIVTERTSYMEMQHRIGTGSSLTPPTEFIEFRTLTIKGKSSYEFVSMLASFYSKSNGWDGLKIEKKDGEEFIADQFSSPGRVAANHAGWIGFTVRPGNKMTIMKEKVLSKWQVWLVRLQHVGSNPFRKVAFF
jgi:hypothetical protein